MARSVAMIGMACLLLAGNPSRPRPLVTASPGVGAQSEGRDPLRSSSVQAADSVEVLLAEVMFAPAPGDTGFVELANVGQAAVDLTSMVLRVDTVVLPLPRLAEPLPAGGRVLIRFDGGASVEGSVVHAPPGFELNPEAGSVSLLRNDGFVLDRVAWGSEVGAVRPTTGGLASVGIAPGSSIGRPPGANRPGAITDWVAYPPDQVTPGRANPLMPVAQLLPLDGAIFEASPVDLGWYPAVGAVRYRVQLGTDTTFGRPLLDNTVSEPGMSSGQLPAGVYWWRVQAIGADGLTAAWSRPSRLELESPGGGDAGEVQASGGPHADEPESRGPVTLNVPYLSQHKDTRMLSLESYQEGRRRTAAMLPPVPHRWDGDHGRLDPNDPADKMNCGLASMAMINHFYHGDLSQDRIGFEMFSRNVARYVGRVDVTTIAGPVVLRTGTLREHTPGPEYDLNYGMGLTPEQMLAEGLYALGTLPGPGSGYGSADEIWKLVGQEIDAGRPLMGFTLGHVFVVRGYELRGTRRMIYVNDPWDGPYAFDLDAARSRLGAKMVGVLSYPTHPAVAMQEPSVGMDSDGDSIVDFDEIERFHTDPNNKDSDRDGVPDKQDIESGIYESQHVYGYAWGPGSKPGRDYDHDGIPSELDPDSDNGGCKDGEEDTNGDGERGGKETDNFDETDDVCGNLQGSVSYLIDLVNTDPTQMVKHMHDQATILVRLKPEEPGSESYVDDGSTFSYQGFARTEIGTSPCILWGHEQAVGSGPFTGDAEIGATRGDDGTLALGAGADVPGQSAAGGCGPGGTNQTSRHMGFPDCTGVLAKPLPGQPNVPTYRFDCTTKPQPPGPGWTVTQFYVRGYIRIR